MIELIYSRLHGNADGSRSDHLANGRTALENVVDKCAKTMAGVNPPVLADIEMFARSFAYVPLIQPAALCRRARPFLLLRLLLTSA